MYPATATTPTGTYEIKTGFVRWALPVAGIGTMLELINAIPGSPSRAQESTAGLYCWGGKVNDLAPNANSFVHRNADFLFGQPVPLRTEHPYPSLASLQPQPLGTQHGLCLSMAQNMRERHPENAKSRRSI